jgi:hypothetical protein
MGNSSFTGVLPYSLGYAEVVLEYYYNGTREEVVWVVEAAEYIRCSIKRCLKRNKK